MPPFIPGLKLNNLFYTDVVKPILAKNFPKLSYTAALIGFGSDVLGFDTEQSTDHMWGPRLYLFLTETDYEALHIKISTTLETELPTTFKGYSVNFSDPDPNDNGVRHFEPITTGPVKHLIKIYTVKSFFKGYLNCNPFIEINNASWLTFTEHRLLAVTTGAVYHDGLNLAAIRHKFAYYPKQIWLYLLASQWEKIGQEEAFVGRCGVVGDELGSGIIAARLVQSLMRLCFLMNKQYAPYSKWFGSAFAKLSIAKKLTPSLQGVLTATTWKKREDFLSTAYTIVAEKHNSLQITKPLNTTVHNYFGRPYKVIGASTFAEEIANTITDKHLQCIEPYLGSVSQFTDSTDVYDNLQICEQLKILYKAN